MFSFEQAATLEEGPERVAAICSWLQNLEETEEKPILVGGAAVELYTGGAYRTGDLDFVGRLSPGAEAQLERAGFRRHGRHWIHEERQIFLEFPSSSLGEGETTALIEVGEYRVLVIGLEELVIDRLAAWQFWDSSVDAVNAFLLTQRSGAELDETRLRELAARSGASAALQALNELRTRLGGREPSSVELEEWTKQDFETKR